MSQQNLKAHTFNNMNLLIGGNETQFAIFIFMASILSIAIYNTSINFSSASFYECFGRELDQYICVSTSEDGSVSVLECVATHNPASVYCHAINKVNVTPGLKAEIDANVIELGPSNPNDSKDIGGMKTDKGITKSPIP